MENNPNAISLSGERLALTLKVYEDKADRITKQMKNLDSRMKKLAVQKMNLGKELEELKSLINQVLEKEPGTGEFSVNEPLENAAQKEEGNAVFEPFRGVSYGLIADSFGMDVSGYNESFRWDEKIEFVLRNAPKALKRGDITRILRAIDNKLKSKDDNDFFRTLAPYLSKMTGTDIIQAADGSYGNYYLHPSWIENGEIKPEFKDKCPENIRII